jgi:hypothetical protein
MSILLSDEFLFEELYECGLIETAKVTVIHAVQFMEEECKEHQIARYKDKWQLRLNCPDCMAEIHKELNLP